MSEFLLGQADATPRMPVDFSTSSDVVVRVEELWKQYRYGTINHGTLSRDLQSWWARARGKDDPNQRIDSIDPKINNSNLDSDRFWALRDISFDVRQGEILGIIGRNGAGKSTLLKILSRVTTPTRGQVKIKGRVASLLEVGTGFHPELSGRENIFLNGAILGMTKFEIKRKFEEIVAFSGVEKFLDTPVKRYSSGMYVRLAFAVAAHLEPEILIVDEVLAVGDAEFQKKCLSKMRDFGREGRTVLFVSHNLDAILRLCDSAILLESGGLVGDGPTNSILEKYTLVSINSENNRIMFNSNKNDKLFVFRNASFPLKNDDKQSNRNILNLNIEYEIFTNTLNAVVAIRIETIMGTPVMTLTDNDLNLSRFVKHKGVYQAVCKIPVGLLAPGRYYITLSAADMQSTRYDYRERALSLEVSQNKKVVTTFQREGPMLVPVDWDITSLE